MPQVQLADVQALPDVLLSHRYAIDFPSDLPGAGNGSVLNIRCQQVSFPGSAVNQVQTELHGFRRNEAGRKEHPGTFTATFVETRDMPVWTALKAWQEEIRGTNSGTSSVPRDNFVVTADITIYDEMDQVAGTCKVYKCWPQDVPEVSLDSSGETQFLVQATFSYDYIEYPSLFSTR